MIGPVLHKHASRVSVALFRKDSYAVWSYMPSSLCLEKVAMVPSPNPSSGSSTSGKTVSPRLMGLVWKRYSSGGGGEKGLVWPCTAPSLMSLLYTQLWEVDPSKHHPGQVEHTIGWPLVSRPSAVHMSMNPCPTPSFAAGPHNVWRVVPLPLEWRTAGGLWLCGVYG